MTLELDAEERKVYTQLFRQADTESLGVVVGANAVPFFNKSKLPPAVLAEIWQLADSADQGFLTKDRFDIALKLIALAQNGVRPSLSALTKGIALRIIQSLDSPLPVFHGFTLEAQQGTVKPTSSIARSLFPDEPVDPIPAQDRTRYAELFAHSEPVNDELDGVSCIPD